MTALVSESSATAPAASATTVPPERALLLERLREIVGTEHVLTDADELAFYSTDVYRRAEVDAVFVLRPGTVDELMAVVGLCTSHGHPVVPRGGGLSYTGGFLPVRADTVVIDLLRLDRIVRIDPVDMYVTVEAGATWKSLYEALKPLGLRTPYFGPMSGFASSIGGALSQGSVFLGSTQYGTTAESVLSLDVVLADGTLVQTGSAGGTDSGPFFRAYGPDLTGLFLHDAGALGFKARATLRLLRTPAHSGFASFTFGTQSDLLTAMSEIARRGLAAECFGADPYIWSMRLWDDDLGRDVKRAIGVVKSGRSLASGLKDAVKMAVGGRQALKDVEYAMNVAVDGRTPEEVDHALNEIRGIAARGREVEATVPRMVRGAPFMPPNDILGPRGQRWAPSHGIAPHSRVVALGAAVQAFFAERKPLLERFGIEWGFVVFAISQQAILFEPMLYWPDARERYHERMIAPSHLSKLPVLAADSEAAAAMRTLRGELVALWAEEGCAHLQIGKTYRYLSTRQPNVRHLLVQLKDAVDPRHLVNPGSLGFDA